jgi:hypothetical protein
VARRRGRNLVCLGRTLRPYTLKAQRFFLPHTRQALNLAELSFVRRSERAALALFALAPPRQLICDANEPPSLLVGYAPAARARLRLRLRRLLQKRLADVVHARYCVRHCSIGRLGRSVRRHAQLLRAPPFLRGTRCEGEGEKETVA